MPSVFHSPFLQALGYAIAGSLWQMAIVWIIFSITNILFKPNAANKYRLAVVLQLTGFAWFMFTLQFYYKECYQSLQLNNFKNINDFTFVVTEQGKGFSSNLLNWMVKAEQVLPFLSAAYLLLLIVLLVKWATGYQRTQLIRKKNLLDIGIEWQQFIEEAALQAGIKQKVSIFLSEYVTSPLTVGFIKPLILVPVASINNLTTAQLEAVLLHELAHIKRFDYLFNIILSVVETALFFNPFTQLISKSIKGERENCCDDYVLQFKYSPSLYAEALLQVAYLSKQTPASLTMNAVKKNGDLLSRVKRMIDSANNNKFNYRNQLLSLLLITILLSSVAWLKPSINKNSVAASISIDKTKQQIVVEPMAARIDNPLFNPIFFLQKPLQKIVADNIQLMVDNNIENNYNETAFIAEKTLQAIAPIAAKQLQDIDVQKMKTDVQQSLAAVKFDEINIPKINIDTNAIKTSLQYVFDAKQADKINADLQKAKADIEKVTASINFKEAVNTELNGQIQKAAEEIKKLNIPFLNHLKLQQVNQQKQLNEKVKTLHLQQRDVKEVYKVNTQAKRNSGDTLVLEINMRNQTQTKDSVFTRMPGNFSFVAEKEMVNVVATPALYYPPNEDEEANISSVSVKNNSTNKVIFIRDKRTNKLIEVVIPVAVKGQANNKVVIEINKQ